MKETPDRWQKLKDIFNDVSELAPESRPVFLSKLRLNEKTIFQELSELLDAEKESEEFLRKPLVFDSDYSLVGQTVGHYRIVGEIGRGGMGAVFEAVREDGEFEQKAAVKLTNRNLFSDELVKRFRVERQILANLEHGNIVRLLDGGITPQHIPYFVMEYVEGVPITKFCTENSLGINDRLNLFLQICEAVAYAHRQLIVHRDLKPSNILVTADGEVKLLDFGIAKMLDSDIQTLTANAPLTPEYASPEQIKGETITTASDIYSLGVILYELLTEKSPYEIYGVERPKLHHAVCEIEPSRPSSIISRPPKKKDEKVTGENKMQRTKEGGRRTKSLRGDLDNIVLKSLQKDKEQRYGSVEQFAEDIKAHLGGLTVKAHPQSFVYQASKFIRRNRLTVAVAAASVLLILSVASLAVWQAFAAQKQKQIAEQNFDQVRKIANSLILDYHDEIAKLEGSTQLRERLVVDAINYLDAISVEETDNAELLKELAIAYRKIGDVQGMPYAANLGKADDAARNYQKSVDLLEKAESLQPQEISVKDELVKSYNNLAQLNGRLSINSFDLMQKAVAISEDLIKLDPNNLGRKTYWLKLKMGQVGSMSGNQPVRIAEYKKILADAQPLYAEYPQNVDLVGILTMTTERIGTQYRWMGNNLKLEGKLGEAQRIYKEGFEYSKLSLEYMKLRQSLEPNDIRNKRKLFVANANLSIILICLEQPDEAEKYRQVAEKLIKEIRLDDPNNKETSLDEITVLRDKYLIYVKNNKFQAAYQTANTALEMAKAFYRNNQTNSEGEAWVGYFYKQIITDLENRKNEGEAQIYRKDFDEFKRQYKEKYGSEFISEGSGL